MKPTIVLTIFLMLPSAGTLAAGAKAEAMQHIASARVLHAQQRYTEAIAALEAAYLLDPQPALLFALGQLHVQLGRCERAVAFYHRFLATRPKPEDAAIAREAITTCKTASLIAASSSRPITPPRVTEPSPATEPPPITAPLPIIPTTPAAAPLALPVRATTRSHRTARVAGISLVAAGVGAAVGSFALFRGAVGDRDRAEAATTYGDYEPLIERANTRYRGAVAVGAIGVAAITAGAIVFAVHRRDTVHAIHLTPGRGGASVGWSTPF